jgi:hypothetical protein
VGVVQLTHGLEALRNFFGNLLGVPVSILDEVAIGMVYAGLGYTVFQESEYRALVLGTLDLVQSIR